MTLVLAILAAIPALYGLVTVIAKVFKKTPAEKAIDAIKDVDKALEKSKKGDTSALEDIFNK